MVETIKKEWAAKVALVIFIFFTSWWVIIQFPPFSQNTGLVQNFGVTYGVMALWGGIWGVIISKKWGGKKSIMGKAILFFALGLFAQVFGQIAYSYYIYILGIEVPYPSLGDIGYFGSIPLYIYGVWLLAKASGAQITLGTYKNKIQALLIPILMLVFSYILFLQNYEFDWTSPLAIFLDFGYPMGQAIYISIAILTYFLTRKMLGGVMKYRILFILFALFVQYISDYTFLYQVSNETWRLGGINEFMYLVSYLLMTLAIIQLETVFKKLRHQE